MNKKIMLQIIDHVTHANVGSSSMAITRFMLGLPPVWWQHTPMDYSDRGRCIVLLKKVPEFADRLDEMASLSKEWAEQIKLIRKEWESVDAD